MTARVAIGSLLVPLGLAGVFHLVGIQPSAVLFLFLPYWAALLLREADKRLHEHLPRSEDGFLATGSYPVALLGVVLGFGWLQAGLEKPTFSFLLGVAFFNLWPLLLFLQLGVLQVMKRAFKGFKWAFEGSKWVEWYVLAAFLAPLVVDLIIYAMWIPPERILTLPLAAGAFLALLVTFATMFVLGERIPTGARD